MDWLESYGKPLFHYRGVGTAKESDTEETFDVQFEIAQISVTPQ